MNALALLLLMGTGQDLLLPSKSVPPQADPFAKANEAPKKAKAAPVRRPFYQETTTRDINVRVAATHSTASPAGTGMGRTTTSALFAQPRGVIRGC